MKNRDIYWRRYKIQETLYIGQWSLSPLQSRHLGASHSSPSPSAAPLYFPESHQHQQIEISSISMVILVLGKARSHRAPNMGCRGTKSPGWFGVSPKNCIRKDARVGTLLWWSCQSPVASFWIVQIVSAEECSSLVQSLVQIRCSTHSVILDVMAIQYTCSFNGVCHPHWLVQWSCHCSHMCIPVHSP